MKKHFSRGTGNQVFKCGCCGRSTRDNGTQSLGSETCPQCWDIAGYDNQFNDDGRAPTEQEQTELRRLLSIIESRGGDSSAVIASNNYAFPTPMESYIMSKSKSKTVKVDGVKVTTTKTAKRVRMKATPVKPNPMRPEGGTRVHRLYSVLAKGKGKATRAELCEGSGLESSALGGYLNELKRVHGAVIAKQEDGSFVCANILAVNVPMFPKAGGFKAKAAPPVVVTAEEQAALKAATQKAAKAAADKARRAAKKAGAAQGKAVAAVVVEGRQEVVETQAADEKVTQ